MENIKVKQWYISTFHTDELGTELNSLITFKDVFNTLDSYQDIYKLLGVDDSIVRERVFAKLSEIMKVDYDYIYNQWLKG